MKWVWEIQLEDVSSGNLSHCKCSLDLAFLVLLPASCIPTSTWANPAKQLPEANPNQESLGIDVCLLWFATEELQVHLSLVLNHWYEGYCLLDNKRVQKNPILPTSFANSQWQERCVCVVGVDGKEAWRRKRKIAPLVPLSLDLRSDLIREIRKKTHPLIEAGRVKQEVILSFLPSLLPAGWEGNKNQGSHRQF